jgi:serine/threonine protein kinase
VDLADEIRDAPELQAWEFGRELGRGATGTVHAATERITGARRAIKLVRANDQPDAAADARIRREIDNNLSLLHPNVVRGYCGGRAGLTYFLVMELCGVGNLHSAVANSRPLDPRSAVLMFLDVFSGLEYAHSAPVQVLGPRGPMTVTGLVHRDVKPQNIFLTEGFRAKVGDFGLAKAFEAAGISGLTRTGSAAGTPAFMPRQQLLDYKYAPPAVDVWAAAASLYFALSGFTPRDFPLGRDPWRIVWDTQPVPLARRDVAVPSALAAVLDGALADEREQLPYATVAEFRQAVEAACHEDGLELP